MNLKSKKSKNSALILGGIGETLLLPLWARARDYKEQKSILNDKISFDIQNQIDYDFSAMDLELGLIAVISLCVRAKNLDAIIKKFIDKHPRGTIISLGSGLETTFFRVDNGKIKWYDLDLKRVIDLRKLYLPESKRVKYLDNSIFKDSWCKKIDRSDEEILIIACGLFMYFEKNQIKKIFSLIIENFPSSELAFDWHSKAAIAVGNEKNLKKLNFTSKMMNWGIRNPKRIALWDKRIEIIDIHTRYAHIPREASWGKNISNKMDLIDKRKISGIIHLKFNG